MTDLEMGLISVIHMHQRGSAYRRERYQMLHGIKYKKKMSGEHLERIRRAYPGNCVGAAYELKTYYAENGILSNTIVLKTRPVHSEIQEFTTIQIHSDLENKDKKYTHHAIEVFKENGKYKVLDILHTDRVIWLETYLDEVCRVNHRERNQLRYDFGYMAPCHVYADNMQELTDLMRYIDRVYQIGKPRLTIFSLSEASEADPEMLGGMWLSDDLVMDSEEIGRVFDGCTGKEVAETYQRVAGALMGIQFNMLNLLCLSRIMRDPIMIALMTESIFDDGKTYQMIDRYLSLKK